jgi:hypothetical protein
MNQSGVIVIARSVLSGAAVCVAESKDRDEAISTPNRGLLRQKPPRNDRMGDAR